MSKEVLLFRVLMMC